MRAPGAPAAERSKIADKLCRTDACVDVSGETGCREDRMLAWMKDLTPRERRTMGACFGGWSLDAFDVQMYSFVIPTVIALWPAVRVFWIRRHIEEPGIFDAARRERRPVGAAHLFAAFRGP